MIFIGAGVPAVFEIPALSEMTDIIRNKYSANAAFAEQIDIVVDSLKQRGFNPDIENVLTVLEALKDEKRVYSEIGPKVATLQMSGTIREVADIPGLISNIKLTIKELCMKPNWDKSDAFYKRLVEELNHVNSVDREGRVDPQAAWVFKSIIVTTNYDMTIEESLHELNFTIHDGFEEDKAKRELVFKAAWPRIDDPWRQVNLVKLHGSIDYFKQHDGTVIRDPSVTRLGRDRRKEELLIYPAGEKSITSTPYFDLYAKFRHSLFQRRDALCLGFSFRDFAIRNIFSDWLSLNPKARLIVYSRNPQSIHSLFPSELAGQIQAWGKQLDSPELFKALPQQLSI